MEKRSIKKRNIETIEIFWCFDENHNHLELVKVLAANVIQNLYVFTPPNSEIICGRNVSTKVVCGIILFFEKKAMLKI